MPVCGLFTLILKYDVTKFLNAYDTICIMITWCMAIIHTYVPLVLIWLIMMMTFVLFSSRDWFIDCWLISYTDNILLIVSFDQLLMSALFHAYVYSYHWIVLYKNPSGTYLCMLHKFLAICQSLNILNDSSTLYNTWNLSLLSKTYRPHILLVVPHLFHTWYIFRQSLHSLQYIFSGVIKHMSYCINVREHRLEQLRMVNGETRATLHTRYRTEINKTKITMQDTTCITFA